MKTLGTALTFALLMTLGCTDKDYADDETETGDGDPGDGDGDGDGEPGPCEPFVEGDLGEPSFLWGPCDSGQCASWCGVQLECMAEGGVTVCAAPGIAPSCDVLPASPHTSTSATQDGDACVLVWYLSATSRRMTNRITITLALTLSACGPQLASDGEWNTEFGEETGDGDGYDDSSATNDIWAEIRCFELAADITTCAGRPQGSEDAWVLVVPECDLEVTDLDAWSDDTCASGSAPSNFLPESFCYWSTKNSSSQCFSGGDGWFTQVAPKCDAQIGPVVAWPAWQCDGTIGHIGQHPWDAVLCSAESSSACTAIDNNDAMLTWPTCWIVAWPPLPVREC